MTGRHPNTLKWLWGIFGVAILAIILFPRPDHCEERSRAKAKCLNNLKQCAQALKMYADDYDGRLPSSYLVSRSKTWSRPDALIFCSTIGTFPPGSAKRQTWAQVLYDHIYEPKVAFCPLDPVSRKNSHARISYWYKLANDKAWYGIGCDEPRRSIKDYRYPVNQIAFYEHAGWHFGDTSGRLKNGQQINAVFMDTHVETIVFKNATSGDPINCAASSDGEPMYFNTQVKQKAVKLQKGPATLTDPTCCYDSL